MKGTSDKTRHYGTAFDRSDLLGKSHCLGVDNCYVPAQEPLKQTFVIGHTFSLKLKSTQP